MQNERKILIERKSTPLNYIKESGVRSDGKHYLGKLAGIAADCMNPTRNDRKYPLQLWINVENSDDFKEGMETLTIFGECDHPETRVDTSIKEIAIVLTKFEIRKDEGVVYCEFDILDTPNGRILKELLDYGSKIGVSSRGIGDEVVRNGETIIDPDTYIFYGFDAVVMPAVKSARPAVVESVDPSKRPLNIQNEIDSATSRSELESIRKLIESTNIPGLDSLVESIDHKLESLGNNISDDSELEKLRRENKSLTEKLSANNIRIKQYRVRLSESLANSRNMSRIILANKRTIATLEDDILDGTDQISELTESLDYHKKIFGKTSRDNSHLRNRLESTSANLRESRDRIQELEEKLSSTESMLSDSRDTITSMRESYGKRIRTLESKVKNLNSSNKLIESKFNEQKDKSAKILSESKKSQKQVVKEFLAVCCKQSNIKQEVVEGLLPDNYGIEDIKRVVSELSDRERRLNKVPIAIRPRSVVLSESPQTMISEEDRQTLTFLKSFN